MYASVRPSTGLSSGLDNLPSSSNVSVQVVPLVNPVGDIARTAGCRAVRMITREVLATSILDDYCVKYDAFLPNVNKSLQTCPAKPKSRSPLSQQVLLRRFGPEVIPAPGQGRQSSFVAPRLQ